MAKMALPCRSMPPKKIKSMVDDMGVFLAFGATPSQLWAGTVNTCAAHPSGSAQY
jgi:hypothetical protein